MATTSYPLEPPVIGWRAWNLTHCVRDGGALTFRGLYTQTLWPPTATMVATCDVCADPCGPDCPRCGLYAFPNRVGLLARRRHAGIAHGEIELTGRVYRLELRFTRRTEVELRGERGRILRLLVSPEDLEDGRVIGERLGVPVETCSLMGESWIGRGRIRRREMDRAVLHLRDVLRARPDPIHGLEHAETVARTGIALADRTRGADRELVELFGYLHDIRRDARPYEHARLAGDYARELHAAGVLVIDAARLETLCLAIERHAHGETTDDPTIGCCWDADRLDLTRVRARIDPQLLSTKAAIDVTLQAAA